MSTKVALAQAKLAIDRGEKIKARLILQSIVATEPTCSEAAILLREMAETANHLPRSVRRLASVAKAQSTADSITARAKLANDADVTKCSVCEALIAKDQLARHYQSFHPGYPLPRAAARPKPAKSTKKSGRKKKRKSNSVYTVSLSDTAGIAMVSASRKKGGGGWHRR